MLLSVCFHFSCFLMRLQKKTCRLFSCKVPKLPFWHVRVQTWLRCQMYVFPSFQSSVRMLFTESCLQVSKRRGMYIARCSMCMYMYINTESVLSVNAVHCKAGPRVGHSVVCASTTCYVHMPSPIVERRMIQQHELSTASMAG